MVEEKTQEELMVSLSLQENLEKTQNTKNFVLMP